MPVPATILNLVSRFAEHVEAYKSGSYNETQVRRDFLDPFFRELGWDIDNISGYAEAYRDVIHEDQVRVGAALKAPDYGFRIGGQRKFFLEAKKPAVDIKTAVSPAYQLRRYAWSAKLPLSILSDFEEFAVYDTRIKPSPSDPASTGRIFYCRFEEYPHHWDHINGIFSIEAIRKGSFDKYAATSKGKRGSAEVDIDFLATIEGWRSELARNLALRNSLTKRELNFAVQSILDRIIFLRICEDRGIEDYERLKNAASSKGVYPALVRLFQEADDRYNSGLFHFRDEKSRPDGHDALTPHLTVDDDLLKRLIRGLYYPESPYEFSVFTADILGQVYEQFLGKVITLTAQRRAVVEDKPEVKKAGGVYYTPTYIVDYIVRQTISPLIDNKTPKQIAHFRVLDPACGSGSFLIAAYQFLLDWYHHYYTSHETDTYARGKEPRLAAGSRGGWVLTTTERKRILLAHIFGVDIDSQAVEVTKLSLLLKVLEGETAQTIQRELVHERVLPDLGNNIKCGNSLVGSDFYDQKNLPEMDADAHHRINVFDWGEAGGFPHIMKSGGFDAVIGNPPYGAYLHDEAKSYLLSKFPHQTYQLDTYLLFLEHALTRLVRSGGHFGMIIPNPWLTNLTQDKIRRFVLGQARVREIVHFRFAVFPRVVVDTQIVLLARGQDAAHSVTVSTVETLGSFLGATDQPPPHRAQFAQAKWSTQNGAPINIFVTPAGDELVAKIEAQSSRLESHCLINVGIKPYQKGKGTPPQTRETVETRPFDSDYKETQAHRLYLRGRDIGRYRITPVKPRYLKYGPWLAEPRPAANFDAKEKIVMRQTGDSLVAAMDDSQLLCLNNMHVLVSRDSPVSLRFLLGVINSRLLNWFYHSMNPEIGEALAEVKKTNVARLPIRDVDFGNDREKAAYDRIVLHVEKILGLHRQRAEVKTPHEQAAIERQLKTTDAAIDREVYALYGLTEDQIALVEGSC